MKVIYGFYHIACMNGYEGLVETQLTNLKNSGLLDKTKVLFIGCLGTNDVIPIIGELLHKHNIHNYKLFYFGIDFKRYEFDILNKMLELSIDEEFLCYYFHTKGVSITPENCGFYHGGNYTQVKESVNSWRIYMEDVIFHSYEKCVKFLENENSVGATICSSPLPHYPGNFWWSKSDHIKKLQRLYNLNSRYDAEFWVGSGDINGMVELLGKSVSYLSKVEGYL